MTIVKRAARDRGHANHGWLNTYHTFSFADYYDPYNMGFRDLRVINDDTISPSAGFPTHGHKDMEIITYVTQGALAHKDSTGSEGVIKRGDVQAMSAGSGVRHSEFNAADEETKLFQIWIMPKWDGLPPSYGQTHFSDADKHNKLRMIAGFEPKEGALKINQDASIYASILDEGFSLGHTVTKERGVWIQLIKGQLRVNNVTIGEGDGLSIEDADTLRIKAEKASEFLLFDLN